jgi:hypothetical protein
VQQDFDGLSVLSGIKGVRGKPSAGVHTAVRTQNSQMPRLSVFVASLAPFLSCL